MTHTPTQERDWEKEKQEWLDSFDEEYGDDLTAKVIGILAESATHAQLAPVGDDASYITKKLLSIFAEERAADRAYLAGEAQKMFEPGHSTECSVWKSANPVCDCGSALINRTVNKMLTIINGSKES